MTSSFNWTSTFGSSSPDPGIERRDRETLEREKELQRLIESEKEEDQILTDNAERIRQKDLEENPPLENLESRNLETKPEHWLLRSLGWVGDRFDDVDRAAGIGEFNVYNARQKILKPLSETHVALGILGEFFVPDTFDIATLGFSYIPKRFAKIPKVWAKLTKAMNADAAKAILKGDDMIIDAKEIAKKYNMTMHLGKDKGLTGGGFNYLPNVGPDELLDIHKTYATHAANEAAALLRDSVNPNMPLRTRVELAKAVQNSGYDVGGTLHYNAFRQKAKLMAEEGRSFLGQFEAGTALSGAPRYIDFKAYKGPELERLREEFSDAIIGIGLNPQKSVNVHHIAALKAVMGIWDGLQLDSKLYREVSETLLKKVPGLGDNPSNLLGVVGRKQDVSTPHHLVHRFYADTIGEAGEKFFTPAVLENMKHSRGYRLKKAEELGDIIAESERIVKTSQTVFKELYGKTRSLPEDLVETLHDIPLNNDYTLPVLKNLLRDIIKDFDKMTAARSAQGLELLKARVADPSIKMKVQGKRQLTPQKVNKEVDKAVKDAGDTYQPTLDPRDPKYNP